MLNADEARAFFAPVARMEREKEDLLRLSSEKCSYMAALNQRLRALERESGVVFNHGREDRTPHAHLASRGTTALMLACSIGDVDMVSCLLDARASVTCRDAEVGDTPAFFAVRAGRMDALELLMARAGDTSLLSVCNFAGENIMHAAAEGGHVAMARFVRETCGSARLASMLTTPDTYGNLPLHVACKFGHLAFVHFIFLCEGVPRSIVNSATVEDFTPIMAAARWGHFHIVRYLDNAGAALDTIDAFAMNVLHHAIWQDNSTIVDYLVSSRGGRFTDMLASIGLLGMTPLCLACWVQAPRSAFVLLEACPRAARIPSSFATMPLEYAAAMQHPDSAELCTALVRSAGAPLQSVPSDELSSDAISFASPLAAAIKAGNASTTAALTRLGADVNAVDASLDYHSVVSSQLQKLLPHMPSLVAAGVDLLSMSNAGCVPLEDACRCGYAPLVMCLIVGGMKLLGRGSEPAWF